MLKDNVYDHILVPPIEDMILDKAWLFREISYQ